MNDLLIVCGASAEHPGQHRRPARALPVGLVLQSRHGRLVLHQERAAGHFPGRSGAGLSQSGGRPQRQRGHDYLSEDQGHAPGRTGQSPPRSAEIL